MVRGRPRKTERGPASPLLLADLATLQAGPLPATRFEPKPLEQMVVRGWVTFGQGMVTITAAGTEELNR